MAKAYLEEYEEVLKEFGTKEDGLSSAEANERLLKNGKNKLQEAQKETMFQKFIDSLRDPMIIMLLFAALLQAIINALQMKDGFQLSEFADVIIILVVVIINTIMSLVQEVKAEGAMDALMQMTASTSKVMRDGKCITVKSEDICVGDIVVFEAGDTVSADCRVIESHSLKAEESALTGESVPVTKLVNVLMLQENKEDITLGDRKNMVYNGSTIVYGRGKAVVVATGMDTEVGKIADALNQTSKELTPLQRKMTELSNFLTKLVIGICVVVFVVGVIESLLFSKNITLGTFGSITLDTFIAAIALAVAAIPEGLPAVVTVILSLGVSSMAKRQALIRKLTAVETLGCTNIICSDKTGTLTQNKMTVVDHYASDETLLATAMALCSDATIEEGQTDSTGEPTECALVNYANTLHLPKYELEEKSPRVSEAPFDSNRKMMSTIHKQENQYIQYTKGALDVLLDRCTTYLENEKEITLTEEKKQEILTINKQFASQALRVLCAAYKRYDILPTFQDPSEIEKDLTFVGIVGMIDPCRSEVQDAIVECKNAGIKVIMITGDHKDTAVAIGKNLGIIEDESQAIEGYKLDAYDEEQMKEVVTKYSVYARVQPEHKTKIVNAWKEKDMITAMTGDGVNDAPSIKAADIGIGMGITGTDVTKSVADMVLADDNFATIVNAVKEGRKIYDNVCKVIQFQLSTNLSEVVIMFFASILNFTILSPVHLLWINMVTDSLPGLALGMEKAEGDVMKRKPRSSEESIFSNGAGVDMVWQGLYLALVEILAYLIGHKLELGTFSGIFGGEYCVNAVAMAFLTVNFAEICCCINMRSRRHSIFSKEMLKNFNWWLFGATILTVSITLAAIYLPGLSQVFGIVPGTFQWNELLICVGLALSTFPVFEFGKWIRKRK